ncbi:hypothetical protein INR49_029923 [Caranx melampygus]|nr:hypothetical protein INR49_029923 [Caranx melampygus]
MSLFLVNRYLGEEEDGSVSKESRSQALLAKLQQKAKEKQEQSLTDRQQTVQQPVKKIRKADEDSNQEPRRHKKRKSEEEPVDVLVSGNNDEAVKEKRKKKCANEKQKKKHQSGSSAEALSDTPVMESSRSEDTGEEDDEADDSPKEPTEKTSAPTSFTVIGGFENKSIQKVHRVLPQWLAQPDVIHRDIKSNLVPISDISGLCPALVKKLQNNGIQHFFPVMNSCYDFLTVQAEVIPAVLESTQQGLLIGRGGYKPRDICVSAPTGSGKTLAFVIPVIQVFKVFTSYTEGTALKVVILAGQKSFAAEQASLSENRGDMRRSAADIVVATPGRLVDHINKDSGLCLEHLRFLIIDEADRMIDRMHQSWLSQVVKAVYRSGDESEATSMFRRTEPTHVTAASLSPPQVPLQKLLFSATLTQNPEKLQQLGLHQPRLFSSIHSQSSTTAAAEAPTNKQDRFDFPQGLTEYYIPCTLNKKPLLIMHCILRMKLSPILCFTNSRETAHRLFLLVQLFGGVDAAEFSSRLSPGDRKKTLKKFEQGKIQLLISTDAAARGIDINGVKCVVNYDAPQYIRTYIHRIGRTARAGKAGLAFTFLLGVQEKNFLQMVQEAGSPGIHKQIVKPENLKSMEARYEQTLQELANVIKDEKTK